MDVMQDDHNHNNQTKNQTKIDAIAEQWVNLVLAHIRAKKLSKKEPIKIKNKYDYATQ